VNDTPCTAQATARLRTLSPGEIFDDLGGPQNQGWRLVSGALRLDPREPQALPAQLALPGDQLGVEGLLGRSCPYRVRALVTSQLEALDPPASDAASLQRLSQVLAQQWRRAADMTRLRTGGVPDRVKCLLLMLGAGTSDGDGLLLPRLRDFAAVVASTPESVSRVITNLRRLQLLGGRSERVQHLATDALTHCRLPGGMTNSRAGSVLTARAALVG
jgi:CRP-like cAMP-binding protein